MKYYIRKIFFIAFAILTFSGCTDNNPEQLFDDSPTERVNSQITLVRDLLMSSEQGWKTTYFTDDSELGGFTYLMKFVDDKTVEMDSDFGETKGTITSSEWDVKLGSTVKLSFATKNKIHELSDSDSSPDDNLLGQGYKGSIEFLYYGQDGEDLIFRANKGFNEVRFVKATSEDWTDLTKNDDIINTISFSQLIYQVGSVTTTLGFNIDRRFATNVDETQSDTNLGIGFTPTGIIVSPAIKVGTANEYSNFTLNDNKSAFISDDGEFTILIFALPFNINQDWVVDLTDLSTISTGFLNNYVDVYNANVAVYGEDLQRQIAFGNSINGSGIMFFSLELPSQIWGAEYFLNFSPVLGSPNQLAISKVGEGLNWSFYRHLDPLLDYIVDNAPYTVVPNAPINPTEVKLTSTVDLDAWFVIKL